MTSGRTRRVLYLEDEPGDVLLVRELLEGGPFVVEDEPRLGTALTSLARRSPDVVLLDLSLPDATGLEGLERLLHEFPALPVIVLTGLRDESRAVQALAMGAQDYVIKGLGSGDLLARSIRYAIGRKRAERRLELQSGVGRVLASANDLEGAASGLLRAVCEGLGWRLATLWLPSAEGLWCVDAWHPPGAGVEPFVAATLGRRFDRGESAPERARATDRPLWIADAGSEPALLRRDAAAAAGLHTGVVFPVGNLAVIELFSGGVEEQDPALLDALASVGDRIAAFVDRTRATQALRKSEERFRELAESVHEVFWLADARTHEVYYVSPACRILFGRAEAELCATPTARLGAVHPEDRPRVERAYQVDLPRGAYDERYRVVRPDGSVRWVRDRGYLVRNAEGEVVRYAGAIDDVTALKEAEEALRGSEAQLRQAQKMEAVGRLAGGVAHDFNNLLTVISGHTELVLSRLPPGDPARRQLEQVAKAGQRAAGLTRQLLAFSRKERVAPRRLDLNEAVRAMEQLLRRLIGEDVELVTHLQPGLGAIKADPGQLEQVVMNLAVNSRDAMPRGGRLTITTAAVELGPDPQDPSHPTGPHAQLSVTDTGHGMTEEVLGHLFEPFFTTKAQGRGTGLGLSVVYGIVQQGGGRIGVESAIGQGTTFRIQLPLVDGPPEVVEVRAQGAARGSETILLVEDEEMVLSLAKAVLEEAGYRVVAARDGVQALAAATQHQGPIHLLVTDVVMPAINGRDLAERLLGLRPDLRVLYMSGYTAGAVTTVLEAGTTLLQKPFLPPTLLRAVREALDPR